MSDEKKDHKISGMKKMGWCQRHIKSIKEWLKSTRLRVKRPECLWKINLQR